MKNLIKFISQIGQLRKVKRRGDILIKAKNPSTVVDHSFRTAILGWILAKEKGAKLDLERILKMALIHDLCEIYTGDLTPYDFLSQLPKDPKKWPELFDKWPRLSEEEKIKAKEKRYKKEKKIFLKLISKLSPKLKKEFLNLWEDYERGFTKEGRFVKQINRVETLLQALEHSKDLKKKAYKSWWIGTLETVDDPFLLKFIDELAKEFHFAIKK